MKFSEEQLSYLNGQKFSSGLQLMLENNPLDDRISTLLNILKGKNVLHVGACDHVPLINDKIINNTWLHGLLERNCDNVIGIDINKDAVDFVNSNKLSKERIYCVDITSKKSVEIIANKKFDYILLGEILEHVCNPVDFLCKMRENINRLYCIHGGGVKINVILTVPNAFCFLRKSKYNRGIEGINTDHKYWFTPYTISKVAVMAGIKPVELFFANQSGKGDNGSNLFSKKIFKFVAKLLHKPLSYKSFRGDQIIFIGQI